MINSRDINLLRQDVAVNCVLWVERCKAAGLPVLVTNTVRDDEYQSYLYEQGRTRPGSIVTNSRTPTFHNIKCGLAFDFCKNIKGQEYSDSAFFQKAADIAKEMGFSWGGDWKSFVDKPHIQWDNGGRYNDADIKAGRYPPTMPKWEETMDESTFYAMFKAAMTKHNKEIAEQSVSSWAKEVWDKMTVDGTFDGSRPLAPLTRQEAAIVIDRLRKE